MKINELRALTRRDLEGKLLHEEKAYTKLRFAHAVSPLESPSRLRETRRLIACMKTLLHQKKHEQKS